MTYAEALQKLASLGPELRVGRAADHAAPTPRKFSLDHIRALLRELNDPQKNFPSVLIAGTNGKGSTAATLASIAAAAGLRTALYTSPHLLRVNERMKVSGAGGAFSNAASPALDTLHEIPDLDFARIFTRADATARQLVERGDLPHAPSFFELLTAIAFCWFAEQRVQLAVLEVGLGGRLDATNSVEPIVSVITDIGIDHTEYLGHTLREIAGEKAGILRRNGVLVTLSQHPEANAAIGEAAMRLDVRGVDAARFLPGTRYTRPASSQIRVPQPVFLETGKPESGKLSERPTPEASLLAPNRYDLSLDGEVLHIDSPLAGQHQQRNLALALATAVELRTNHGFAIPNAAIERGVHATVWPGRLEWIASRPVDVQSETSWPQASQRPPLLLDVAHNPAGAWALRAALAQLPESMPRTLIFSCLADKQIDEMAQVLLPLFDSSSSDPLRARDHILFAPIRSPRAATVDELLAAAHRLDIPAHAAPHLPAALAEARALTPPEGIIVATGSVYLIGELRTLALAG